MQMFQQEVAEDINDGDAGTDDFSRGDGDLAAKERAAEEWRLEADRIAPFFNGSGGGSDRLVSRYLSEFKGQKWV